MNTSKKKDISFYIISLINTLFVLKYTERITSFSYLISIIFFIGILFFYQKRTSVYKIKLPYSYVLLTLFIIVSIFFFQKIPVETLNVDRWSVISSFWDNHFAGDYVYNAHSHMGNLPGPMPFYYILALPFYLVCELGYFSLMTFPIVLYLFNYEKIPVHLRQFGLIILLFSPFLMWEIICRSNLLLNGLLVLFALLYCLTIKIWTFQKQLIAGVVIGLVLSTRNVFVLPIIILFIYLLKEYKISIFKTISVAFVSIFVFALTFVPFVFNHWSAFSEMNPFIIQGSFLIPFVYTIGFVFMAIVFGFFCRSKNDVLFFSGLNLFLSIAVYFVYHVSHHGIYKAYFGSVIDISYFILCVPFFLFYFLIEEKKSSVQG